MDLSSLLTQGLSSSTDPTHLHAELWADFMSKVMSAWLPLVMASVVVGRELFGSGTKCFPIDLTDSQPGTNGTLESNISHTPKPVINEISDYSRQLAEYVDIYCAKQDRYESSTLFNYQLFTMMLVIQAAVLYGPVLLWNIKPARKVLCHLRFLIHNIDLLYQGLKEGVDSSTKSEKQKDLKYNIGIWQNSCSLYIYYLLKQFTTVVLSITFITVYSTIPSLSMSNIHDEFLCSVKEKFTVDCAVPSAMVHRCVWGANLALLCLIAISVISHIGSLLCDCCYGSHKPFRELGILVNLPAYDAHLIYVFLKANIESVEKYNYVRQLKEVKSGDPPPANTQVTTPNPIHRALDLIQAHLCCCRCCDTEEAPNPSGTSIAPTGNPTNLTNTPGSDPNSSPYLAETTV
ncbi:PREDICTED: uncharacterized protein LOC109461704 [Branchiostoma belcheri]|uniref:Uncharacterized protein LOC109461704 n=1 Tax=Branchiostoma belcheri TaxID=7741 RepID=A0A6P4XNM2_BRABE|nr:PREDICTED: uncharacterized protein LOC109461704 [Branchiostoma belcheri]